MELRQAFRRRGFTAQQKGSNACASRRSRAEGGVLPTPIVRNSFQLWPAKRREFVVDFGHYMDGTFHFDRRRDLSREHDVHARRTQARLQCEGEFDEDVLRADAEDHHRRRCGRQQRHARAGSGAAADAALLADGGTEEGALRARARRRRRRRRPSG